MVPLPVAYCVCLGCAWMIYKHEKYEAECMSVIVCACTCGYVVWASLHMCASTLTWTNLVAFLAYTFHCISPCQESKAGRAAFVALAHAQTSLTHASVPEVASAALPVPCHRLPRSSFMAFFFLRYSHTYAHIRGHMQYKSGHTKHMHAYIHARLRTCIHARLRTCIHARLRTCIHAHMETYIHAYKHARTFTLKFYLLQLIDMYE